MPSPRPARSGDLADAEASSHARTPCAGTNGSARTRARRCGLCLARPGAMRGSLCCPLADAWEPGASPGRSRHCHRVHPGSQTSPRRPARRRGGQPRHRAWTPGRGAPVSAQHEQYLVGLDLSGRRVVVVGGGQVAQRRVARLIAAGAVVEVVSPAVTPAVEGMASAREITWTARALRRRRPGRRLVRDRGHRRRGGQRGRRRRGRAAAGVLRARRRRRRRHRGHARHRRVRRAHGRRAGPRRAPAVGRGAHGARRGAAGGRRRPTRPRRRCPASRWSAAGPATRS